MGFTNALKININGCEWGKMLRKALPQFVVRGQELPTAYVHAIKFEDRSFTRLRNIEGVPKFRNWVTYPRPRPLRGQFVVRGQELPTAYVHTKFEDRSFIRFRNNGTFCCAALIDPVTLTFDLLTLVGVAYDLGYPCAKFRLPRPFGFRVRADVRDIRQTDRWTDGQTNDGRRSRLNAPAPLQGGGIIIKIN